MTFNVQAQRARFPALATPGVVFADGPAGTQMPESVIAAMSAAMRAPLANVGGPFQAARAMDALVAEARAASADLLGARSPSCVSFGQNMTSLTYQLSRAMAREWGPGDELILTRLDHDANISPWLQAAADRGATVRWLDFEAADGRLDLDHLARLLNPKTRLLAMTHASNALGTIPDVARATRLAKDAGALVFLDAVHYSPHGLVDVEAIGCDALACSAYKFFGPHTGLLYLRPELSERLEAYRLRPASATPPDKWETGTQSFESLVGVRAAIDSIAALGGAEGSRRARIVEAMSAIGAHERALSARFLDGADQIPGLRVYGITDRSALDERTPTFSVRLASMTPQAISAALADRGIAVWDGHYYALAVMEHLGLLDKGGCVRIGFVNYNDAHDIDRVLAALDELARR